MGVLYAVVDTGDVNLVVGARPARNDEEYPLLAGELVQAFTRSGLPRVDETD
jgi:hypothetical protein